MKSKRRDSVFYDGKSIALMRPAEPVATSTAREMRITS